MSDFRPKNIAIQRETLGDSAYRDIREAIISLRLQPGQMVYEVELSNSLGVSRTPVREAFRLLQAEELIEILPQRGIRIAYISKKKVEDALFVRESLESSAFRLVARNWNSEEERFQKAERRIAETLAEQKACAARDDYEGFLNFDEAFHQLILEQSQNGTLLMMISNVRAHLNRVRCLVLRSAQHYEAIMNQHLKILAALRSNDEEKTVQLLRQHIEYLGYDFPTLVTNYPDFFKD